MPTGLLDGECPWCGVKETTKRRRWHPECVTAYRIAAFSTDQRKALRRRDHGTCSACGRPNNRWGWKPGHKRTHFTEVSWEIIDDWNADHRRPLWSAPRDMRLEDREQWFGLSNLQTLCSQCHKEKSAREAAERAGKPRLQLFCEAA
jgi:5-methylcytosine-specific restriction endonuclease McrA